MKKLILFAAAALLLFSCTPGEIVTPGDNNSNDKPATVQVTGITLDKTEVSIKEGESVTLIPTVKPDNATNKSVTWSSSDESVATVDQNGKVTAKAKGTATIKVTAKDGSGVFAECSVSVYRNDIAVGAVDLGLQSGIKWATSNLCESGLCANSWDYGDYYAWGETEPYYSSQNPLTWKSGKTAGYDYPSYKWCKGSYDTMTKYCSESSYGYNGFTDTKTVLDLEDDAAHAKLGGKWRVPTDEEWTELRTKCTWAWKTNYNESGINGRLITGPNGNRIFLPAAGYWFGTSLRDAGSFGNYWSSSLDTNRPSDACYVSFYSDGVTWHFCSRYGGHSVRPVYGDMSTSITLNETSVTLEEGKSVVLVATITPSDASDKGVVWTSSDESVATVDQNGKVTAKAKGTATIKVTAKDGSGVFAECSVSVYRNDTPAGAVDLGLPSGIKWAASNLSESGLCANPWDYGDYYAWGETEPYYSSQNPLTWKSGKTEGYKWPSYKWCKGSYDTLTKYCNKSSYGYNGFTDTKTTLEADDDAARTKLGGKWRMPTDEEWTELRAKCTWTWRSNYNGTGVNGRLITGPNGNRIFLPAAGYWFGTILRDAGSLGYYWSPSLFTGGLPQDAYDVLFSSRGVYRSDSGDRYSGRSVRPVLD